MTDKSASDPNLQDRKFEHIELANKAQVDLSQQDRGLDYEPLFSGHPTWETIRQGYLQTEFLGKTMLAPVWISSMTGGTGEARQINQNLARVAGEFGLGMGLGSCRPLLESDEYFEDFNLRPILGEKVPFFANLGIAQIEQALEQGEADKITSLMERLQVDGLIVHINPLQEFLQPEGDLIKRPAIETLGEFLTVFSAPVMVKEVGQGMGPKSLRALLQLPLAAVDFGAFGGTNFSLLELLRGREKVSKNSRWNLASVGHSAEEMVTLAQLILTEIGDDIRCRNFIISGGIRSALQGYALTQQLEQTGGVRAIYGQAKNFLDHAHGEYEELKSYVQMELRTLAMARAFLAVRKDEWSK